MTPTWERAPAPPLLDGSLIMDAVLRPHRSLSLTAFKLMLGVAIIINVIVAAAFWTQGAFAVAGFAGLDVLALWLAFRFNYRAARREEHVRIAAGKVHIASRDSDGERHYVLNPIWARVLREGQGVLIRAGRSQIRLGAFLSPKECDALAAAIDGALYKAKTTR